VNYRQRWLGWSKQSSNRQIFAAAVTTGFGTLAVSVAAVLKELAIAYQFGVGHEVDAFLIAYLLPSFTVTVMIASLSSILIPVYVDTLERKGSVAAEHLVSSVTVLAIAVFVALIAILFAGSSIVLRLVASSFSAEKRALTESLYLFLLPVVVLGGMAGIFTAILNSHGLFAIAALVPASVPISTGFFVVSYGNEWGAKSIVAGTLVGLCCQYGALAFLLRRSTISLRIRWSGFTPEVRKFVGQYSSVLIGVLLIGGTTIADQVMAAMLPPGSVSALNYGSKVTTLVLGLSAMALGTAVLPMFSRMLAKDDVASVRHTLATYSRLILLVSIPLTAALFTTSEPIVRLIFQRGAFSADDSHLVGQVQAFYVLQIPFYVLSILGMRLLSALYQNRALMMISLGSLLIDIAGNYALMIVFGVSGIALSSSVMWFLTFAMIFGVLATNLKQRM